MKIGRNPLKYVKVTSVFQLFHLLKNVSKLNIKYCCFIYKIQKNVGFIKIIRSYFFIQHLLILLRCINDMNVGYLRQFFSTVRRKNKMLVLKKE